MEKKQSTYQQQKNNIKSVFVDKKNTDFQEQIYEFLEQTIGKQYIPEQKEAISVWKLETKIPQHGIVLFVKKSVSGKLQSVLKIKINKNEVYIDAVVHDFKQKVDEKAKKIIEKIDELIDKSAEK